jgi:hypothetical protein
MEAQGMAAMVMVAKVEMDLVVLDTEKDMAAETLTFTTAKGLVEMGMAVKDLTVMKGRELEEANS